MIDPTRRPAFVVRLVPEPDVDPIKALRLFLKSALRQFGLRCTSVLEEGLMGFDRDVEFRHAMAKATKAARETACTPSIPKETRVHELGDREWSWIIVSAIFSWNNSQRESLTHLRQCDFLNN